MRVAALADNRNSCLKKPVGDAESRASISTKMPVPKGRGIGSSTTSLTIRGAHVPIHNPRCAVVDGRGGTVVPDHQPGVAMQCAADQRESFECSNGSAEARDPRPEGA